MLKNTSSTFGSVTKTLHWLIAGLVILMLALGCSLGFLHGPTFKTVMFIHKSTGVTILCLMIIRLLWRLTNPMPHYPNSMSPFEKYMAHLMAWSFYILIFAIISAGILMSAYHGAVINVWGLFHLNIPVTHSKALSSLYHNIHTFLAWVIASAIVLHTAAALYHHYIRKDNILKRMMP